MDAETYEDTSTALSRRALTAETLDLAGRLHLVVLQDGHLDLLALVLDLLGSLEKKDAVGSRTGTGKDGRRTL